MGHKVPLPAKKIFGNIFNILYFKFLLGTFHNLPHPSCQSLTASSATATPVLPIESSFNLMCWTVV